jgi:hypothetical protein
MASLILDTISVGFAWPFSSPSLSTQSPSPDQRGSRGPDNGTLRDIHPIEEKEGSSCSAAGKSAIVLSSNQYQPQEQQYSSAAAASAASVSHPEAMVTTMSTAGGSTSSIQGSSHSLSLSPYPDGPALPEERLDDTHDPSSCTTSTSNQSEDHHHHTAYCFGNDIGPYDQQVITTTTMATTTGLRRRRKIETA